MRYDTYAMSVLLWLTSIGSGISVGLELLDDGLLADWRCTVCWTDTRSIYLSPPNNNFYRPMREFRLGYLDSRSMNERPFGTLLCVCICAVSNAVIVCKIRVSLRVTGIVCYHSHWRPMGIDNCMIVM